MQSGSRAPSVRPTEHKIAFTIRRGSTTPATAPPKPPRPTGTPQRPPRPTGTPQRPRVPTDASKDSGEAVTRKPTAPSSTSRNAAGATSSSSIRRPVELKAVGAAMAPAAQPRSVKRQSAGGGNYVAVPEDHPLRQHGSWWNAPREAPWATILPELGGLSGWSYSSQSVGLYCQEG